jgi:hypothetical protein
MSRLWATGFELQTASVGIEWTTSVTGSPAIETTTKRTGNAAFRVNNTAASENFQHIVAAAQGVRYYRFYFYLVALSASGTNTEIFSVMNSGNRKVSLRFDTAGNKLELFNQEDSAQIGVDSPTLSTAGWYRFELKIDSTTLASTSVEARLYDTDDSTLTWNPSGTIALDADPNRILVGIVNGNSSLDIIYDDLVVNDSTGSFCNTWAGPGGLIILRPNANNGTPQWTRGGTDSGASWSQVDETTPNDATDYIESNTNNQVDEWTLTDTPAAIGTNDVINWVGVSSRFAISNATGADPDFVLRLKSGANVDETGNLSGAGSTSWSSHQIATPILYPVIANSSNYEVPGGSTAWTKTSLDSAIVGVRETLTDTHFIRVTAVWVYVDFTPGVSGTQYTQSASGGITPGGTIIKDGRKILVGGNTPAGAINKSSAKNPSGTLTSSGSLLKQTQKAFAGVITSIVGTLQTARLYFSTLAGSITPGGTLLKQGNKNPAGTLTSSGLLAKLPNKAMDGTLTSAGTNLKSTTKVLGSILTSSGTFSRLPNKALTGNVSPSGATLKITSKAFTGIVTPSGSLSKQVNKLLAGAVTSIVGTLTKIKLAIKSLDGTLISSGAIAKQANKTLGATITPSGSITKQGEKFLGGIVTAAGSLSKQANKLLSGAITSIVGTLSTIKAALISLGGTLTPSGSISKQNNKSFSGNITPSGGLLKRTIKVIGSALTSAGTLAGDFIAGGGNAFFQSLSGTLTSSGVISKLTSKGVSGNVTPTGTIFRNITTSLSGILTSSGSVLKSIAKSFSGNLTLSGVLTAGVAFLKTIGGSLGLSGVLTKSTGKQTSGNVASSGDISRAISKIVGGILTPIGTAGKEMYLLLAGTLTSFGTLTKILNAPIAAISAVYLKGKLILTTRLMGTLEDSKTLKGIYQSVVNLLGNNKR